MLSLKTTIGLIAALAVVATTSVATALIPQASAQFAPSIVDQDAQNTGIATGPFSSVEQGICQNGAAATTGGVAVADQQDAVGGLAGTNDCS
jgi:hypothetical protein